MITRCWNIIRSGGDWRHLRHARRLRSSDMVITAICVHLMLSMFQLQSSRPLCADGERRNKKIFGGFKFLMARKSPQYLLGCVWCVSMVRCVLRNVEGGLGWQILDTEIQSQAQYILCHLFCHHHRQKFVLERTGQQQLLKTLLRQEFLF